MIHIEGMGFLGSMLALRLDADGIPFTWSDIDRGVCAWRASTGLVYPSGDARSQADLSAWERHADGVSGVNVPVGAVRSVPLVWTQASPPFQGPPAAAVGAGWSVGSVRAVQVDVPTIVRETRTRFGNWRRRSAPYTPQQMREQSSLGILIRAHGFTDRLARYVWGWNRPVMLRLSRDLLAGLGGVPPAIVCREGRFVAPYAYPLLGEPGWWRAGSSMIPQRVPKPLDPLKHFENWRQTFTRLAPFAAVEAWGPPVQGWRPQAGPDDTGYPYRVGDTITFPPLSHSGVRLAPSTIDRALELM
jgi:hypothetical protein